MLRAFLLASAGVPCILAHGQEPLITEPFTKYPGYEGDLSQVAGSVQLGQDEEGTQVIFFDLANVDPNCDGASENLVDNACGIHVHEGTSCDDALGHYYSSDLAADPWATVRYVVSDASSGIATGQNVRVTTGKTLFDMEGRVFLVHDFDGNRIACGLLSHGLFAADKQLLVESFSAYPGYDGNLTVAGSATIDFIGSDADAAQVLTFALSGIDPECGTADITGVDNACGIHVHAGSDCEDAGTIGGHYYNSTVIGEDPWKPIMYVAAEGGIAKGLTIKVVTAVSSEDVAGRTLVVHDATGARIACGAIPDPSGIAVTSGSASSHVGAPLLLAAALAYLF